MQLLQPGRGRCPLQPPDRCVRLPARNELRRRKEIYFFPSSTKFWLGISVRTILTQFYEFISQNIVFNPFITEKKCFFEKNL